MFIYISEADFLFVRLHVFMVDTSFMVFVAKNRVRQPLTSKKPGAHMYSHQILGYDTKVVNSA